ncbi:MAG: 2-C-methyl-D-erythritol 4-phosphate cytidylyltransferase [Shewanellaceae bacterium]|nr:2-C-methyl-D-erythritol 4-phosphate cytidylyltransferase [Shewanellaceae bacterium]
MSNLSNQMPICAVVPAAGLGTRMLMESPKQYLKIGDKTILEYAVESLLAHPRIEQVVVALHAEDRFFAELALAEDPRVLVTQGGSERASSVLNALHEQTEITPSTWALVHDAARPCLTRTDLDTLIDACDAQCVGGVLATPVRDTLKRSNMSQQVVGTVCRQSLWHALTPQLFPWFDLRQALSQALADGVEVTDEASAMEWSGHTVQLVPGRLDNIKVTHPTDLGLVEAILTQQKQ